MTGGDRQGGGAGRERSSGRAGKWLATAAVVVLLLVTVGALGVLSWFHWAAHDVARRITAPGLELKKSAERRPAPEMQFETLDGRRMHLADVKGKVVFLDLWGTWCVQCVAEMPTVQKLYDRYRTDPGVAFLIVSRMDSPARVETFARRNAYTLPFYRMEDAYIPETMQLHQFPSTFLLDKRGELAMEHTGAADWGSPAVTGVIEQLKAE